MPLPVGHGVAISVLYFGRLLVTPGGNTYIFMMVDRFRRRADTFPVTAAELTAEGAANIQTTTFPCRGASSHTLGQRSAAQLQAFTSRISAERTAQACHNSHHLTGERGVERANHVIAQMLAVVVNERHDD